jgi:hypothetical protein
MEVVSIGTRFRNRLSNLNSSLQTVIDETDESKQCSLLIGLFGDDFQREQIMLLLHGRQYLQLLEL